MVWAVARGQAGSPSWGRMVSGVGLFGCRAPLSGAGRTLRMARRIWDQVEKCSCLRKSEVWHACAWAFLCECGSTQHHSLDVDSRLWRDGHSKFDGSVT